MRTVLDLFRYSPSFRYGAIILLTVLVFVILSFFSPYEPDQRRAVPRNEPPSAEFVMGTTSQGQDVFWMLTFAIRNTLLVAGLAVVIGRGIGVVLGMISGYLGGTPDRILSAIVDSFIVIPRLPLLILIAAMLRGQLTLVGLGVVLGLLDWAFPSKRYRSQILSLRERDFTHTAVFAGMRTFKIVMREHLPFIIPFLLADIVSGFLFAIGMEVTLAILGLADMSAQSIGTMIYWGNYYQALLTNRVWVLAAPIAASIIMVVGFYLVSIGLTTYLDPRTRLARLQVKAEMATINPLTIVEARDLKAYYITKAYGVERTVKAVDNISLSVGAGEVYGLAGESGCGKSTLLKVLLGELEAPLTVVGGSVKYHFEDREQDAAQLTEGERRALRWSKVSYIPQGSMHVLNPVRRIRDTFHDFIATHRKLGKKASFDLTGAYLRDLGLPEKVMRSYPHQLSGGMRQRVTIALATILAPDLVFADEPTTALDVVVQRGVIQLLKDIQQKEGSTIVLITHDLGVHANLADRIGVLYAGKLVEEAPTRTILKTPKHPYTQFLIHSLPTFEEREARDSIPGRPPALDNPPSGCRFHPRCPLALEMCSTVEPELIEVAPGHRVACHLVKEERHAA